MTPDLGVELINPKTGIRQVFTATAASSGGREVQVEATYPAHSSPPPVHHHPSQEESFAVLSGAMTVVRGDEQFVAPAGDEFSVPPGVSHQMWNDGDEPAVVRWTTAPALRTGEMFCDLWQAGKDNDWEPTPLQLWDVLQKYDAEFCLG